MSFSAAEHHRLRLLAGELKLRAQKSGDFDTEERQRRDAALVEGAADEIERLWRIADRLASRLYHHATCEQHPKRVGGCPFCDDRDAYLTYVGAGGAFRPPEVSGESIPISEVEVREETT